MTEPMTINDWITWVMNLQKENEVTNDCDYYYMIRENKKNTSKISQGKVNRKKVEILSDPGCSCIIVNNM